METAPALRQKASRHGLRWLAGMRGVHRRLPRAARAAVAVAEPQQVPLPATSLPFSSHFLPRVILPLTRCREQGAFPLAGDSIPCPVSMCQGQAGPEKAC